MFRVCLIFLLLNLAMADEVYQYRDASGNLVVGNKKQATSTKMSLPPLATYVGPREEARQKILQEELEHENLALKQSQMLLTKAKDKNMNDQLELLNTDIMQHQKNIDMLNKQLSN